MSTGTRVKGWDLSLVGLGLSAAEKRGVIAAFLVLEGHCATRAEAHRYVRAFIK